METGNLETGNNGNTQKALDLLASDPSVIGCTWDEHGIIPIRATSPAPLPLRECGIFRPVPTRRAEP